MGSNKLVVVSLLSLYATMLLMFSFLYANSWHIYHTALSLMASKIFHAALLCDTVVGFAWLYFLVRWALFGTVHPREWDGVWETISFEVIQCIFSLSYFKTAITLSHAMQISIMLSFFSFHLLAKARFSSLEQTNSSQTLLKHCLANFAVLSVIDAGFLYFSYSGLRSDGFGVSAYLCMRWSLQLLQSIFLVAKTALLFNHKSSAINLLGSKHYLDLAHKFSHFTTELVYFFFLLTRVGIPIHFMREIYFAVQGVVRAVKSASMYRDQCKTIDGLKEPDPNALQSEDVCIICMEGFGESGTKQLPCGHVFHAVCLYQYIENNSVCAICRRAIVTHKPQEVQSNKEKARAKWVTYEAENLDEAALTHMRTDLQRVLRLLHLKKDLLEISDHHKASIASFTSPGTEDIRAAYKRYQKAYAHLSEKSTKNPTLNSISQLAHKSIKRINTAIYHTKNFVRSPPMHSQCRAIIYTVKSRVTNATTIACEKLAFFFTAIDGLDRGM